MDNVSGWLDYLVPGGVGASLYMVFQAVRMLRESKAKREETILGRWQREVIRLEKQIASLKEENDYLERLSDYWRNRCGVAEYTLRVNGLPPPEVEDLPVRRNVRSEDGDCD